LNNSSGSYHGSYVKFAIGVAGILDKLEEFKNNSDVYGYIDSVVIQACIPHNTQVSVVCFDGVPLFRNPNKVGRDRTSPFNRAPDDVIFAFVTQALRELRAVCAPLIADQVLRVDAHAIRHPNSTSLTFLINIIEGYETRIWGSGRSAVQNLEDLKAARYKYWFDCIDTLVECHLERLKEKASK
jgi:hypothetical protein